MKFPIPAKRLRLLRRTVILTVAAAAALGAWSLADTGPAGKPLSPIRVVLRNVDHPEHCRLRTRSDAAPAWSEWRPLGDSLARATTALQLRCKGRRPLKAKIQRGMDEVILDTKPGGVLQGLVTRADSAEPLANAQVVLTSPKWPGWSDWQAATDGTGAFTFEGLPRPPLELSVRLDGFEAQRLWLSAMPDGPLSLALTSVSGLEAHLVGAKGPAQIWVTGLSIWPARELNVPAGTDRIRIDDLSSGELTIWARTASQVAGPEGPISATPGRRTAVTLTFRDAPVVRGTVVNAAGTPLSNASVQVLPQTTDLPPDQLRTDADGDFVSPPLFSLPAQLWASAPGHLEAVLEADPNDGPVDIILEPTASLTGRVVDAQGSPVAGAEVWATGPTGAPAEASWGSPLQGQLGELGVTRGAVPRVPLALAGGVNRLASGGGTLSDANGAFTLSDLAETELVVRARRDGYATAALRVPDIGSGEPVELVLTRGGSVHGTVRDLRDFPVAGVDVRLEEAGGLAERWTSTDERGQFLFADVRGPVEISALERGQPSDSCALNVAEGDALDCALEVGEPLGSLEVHVQDEHGQPIAGARVQAHPVGDSASQLARRQRITDRHGHVRFSALRLADHKVYVEAAGHVAHAPETATPDAHSQVLELTLFAAGEVAGVVLDSLGAPAGGAQVRTRQGAHRVVTGDEGNFVLDGLPEGPVTLSAQHGDLRSPPLRTRVRAKERVPGLRLSLNGRVDPPDPADQAPAASEPADPSASADPGPPPEPKPELMLAARGAQASVVTHVAPDSTAAHAGFRAGDILTHVDGESVRSAAQARGMLRDPPGEVAEVQVERAGRARTLRFKRPDLR